MTRIEVRIDRLVLHDVPPHLAEGIGPEVERALRAIAVGAAPATGPGRPAPAADRGALAAQIARSVWSTVEGRMP